MKWPSVITSSWVGRYSYLGQADPWRHEVILHLVSTRFYWRPGHSVRVVRDADVILFSPQIEHGKVLDHMLAQMAG